MLEGILPFARTLLRNAVQTGDAAVDATAGNGHDTLFLAELVGENGRVYSFDIQQEAIDNTRKRLQQHGLEDRCILIRDGHENIPSHIPQTFRGRIKGAVFNLGYLPGGDKSIVTKPETTIRAVEGLLDILAPGGIIVLVVYHGHPEGKRERDELLPYVSQLDQKLYHVLRYEFINQKNDPPFIIAIEKR